MNKTTHWLTGLLIGYTSLAAHAGINIEHWTTPAGTRVYFVESRQLPIVDIQVDFAAGGLYVPSGMAGLAGMTHGLLDAGAGDLDEEQIAARQVDTGAQLDGSVDLDRASLHLRSLTRPKEMSAALDLLSTILASPTFPQQVLEREKSRSIAAIRDADTRPDAMGGKQFAAAMYPQHPYGVQPTVASVENLSRDGLVRFYRERYQARYASIAIIGDLSRSDAERIVEQLTAGLPAASGETMPPPAVQLPKAQTIRIEHPATQSHIFIGQPAVERGNPDYIALLVGNYSLGGGGFVSRLMKEVREKRGFAYSVGSGFSPRKLQGPFQIGLQTRRDQATEALAVVNDVLAAFLRVGPTAHELSAAKKNLVDGLALGLDSNAKLLGYLAMIGYYRLPLTYLDDFPKRVQAVTATDVKSAFARHIHTDNLVTVIVAGDE